MEETFITLYKDMLVWVGMSKRFLENPQSEEFKETGSAIKHVYKCDGYENKDEMFP